MRIHEISVNRPVTVLMCVLIVLVLGGVSFLKIPIDLIPNINIPVAIVVTSYSGAGPKEIESIVTRNIENAIATVNNIERIQSFSSEGNSIVIAQFNSNTDMDFATLQMREKIDMAKAMLPSEVDSPMVIKLDPSMMAIANLGITGDMDEAELKKIVDEKIRPRLERLDGVASVTCLGGKTREIKVEINPEKMSGYGTSLNQVIGILQTENLNQPGGSVEYGDKELLIRTTGEFKSIGDIMDIPIILPTGSVIYIRNIAKVYDGYKTTDSYIRTDGNDSIGVVIQKQPSFNTVKVINTVKKEIKQIETENPSIKIRLLFDQGEYIETSLNNVTKNAIIGAVLAIFILLVFLKDFRTTFIIGTAIPISIIATFVLIYFSGITLNLVSLGGLALGVGMLVDNAIVVLENIYRYRNEGYGPKEAANTGTQEVAEAVIASTLTTIAVFLPVVFTQGMVTQIFKELAFTVTFSLLASLIVALTFIPMLSSKYLKTDNQSEFSRSGRASKVLEKWERGLDLVYKSYGKILNRSLRHRKRTVIIAVAIFAASLFLISLVGTEFFPTMDQGQFTVNITMSNGTQLQETNQITQRVEAIIAQIPAVDRMFVTVGSLGGGMNLSNSGGGDTASISVSLKPLKQRNISTAQVVENIRNKVETIPGAEIKVSEISTSMGVSMGSAPLSIKISGADLDKLCDISKQIQDILKSVEGTRQVESSISQSRPEVQIYVDRVKASYYGLGTAQVASIVRTSLQGRVATRYRVAGEEIDVRVQIPLENNKTFEQLKNIKISTPIGVEIPLSTIADVSIEEGPITINRENQQRYVTVSSQIFGRDIGSIIKDINTKLQNISLPSGYSIEFGGEAKEMQEAFINLGQALILAIVLVYMIMAAQFESLMHPFVIMFSIPLAYTGSALGLVIAGAALSVPALLGVIMLAGIVVNNAIVLIDYINKLRQKGMERTEAILKAGPTRLRPILMTTLTTILGLIPLALGIGEGAEMEAPLAIVVIGGLISSTVLTLIVIPIIYTFFDDLSLKWKNKREAREITKEIIA